MPSGVYDRGGSGGRQSRRFAETTKVPADKTRLEIERALRQAGAESFAAGFHGATAQVHFMMQGMQIRFVLQMPTEGRIDRAQQEERRLWRALLLIIKAKIEAINSGVSTFESEFIGSIVVPSGQTVSEWLAPQIRDATKTGKMPRMLLAAPSRD